MSKAGSAITDRDQQLIIDLLLLRRAIDLPDEKGLTAGGFLTGDAERTARHLLSRQLRSGSIPRDTLNALADLIDPIATATDRHLIFGFRRPGRPSSTFSRDVRIAKAIHQAVKGGAKVDSAVTDIGEQYNIKRAMVLRIWMKHKEFVKFLDAMSI